MAGYTLAMATSDEHPTGGAAEMSMKHPFISWSAVAVIFLLLRLMAVSHWNWKTVFQIGDIINFNDAISIVFGTLFAEPMYTGLIIMVLLPLTILRVVWPMSSDRTPVDLVVGILLLVAIFTCTIAMVLTYRYWWLLAGAVIIGLLVAAGRLLWHRGYGYSIISWVLRRTAVIAGIGGLLLATVVTDPWMPLEHIETTSGTIEGYTLKVDSGYLNVLTDDEREVEIIMGDDVVSRTTP